MLDQAGYISACKVSGRVRSSSDLLSNGFQPFPRCFSWGPEWGKDFADNQAWIIFCFLHPFWLILHTSPNSKGCRNSRVVIGRFRTNLVPVVAGTFRLLLQSRFEGCPGRECQKQSHQFFEVYAVFGLELKVLFHPLPEVLYKMPMLQMPT